MGGEKAAFSPGWLWHRRALARQRIRLHVALNWPKPLSACLFCLLCSAEEKLNAVMQRILAMGGTEILQRLLPDDQGTSLDTDAREEAPLSPFPASTLPLLSPSAPVIDL